MIDDNSNIWINNIHCRARLWINVTQKPLLSYSGQLQARPWNELGPKLYEIGLSFNNLEVTQAVFNHLENLIHLNSKIQFRVEHAGSRDYTGFDFMLLGSWQFLRDNNRIVFTGYAVDPPCLIVRPLKKKRKRY